MHHFIRHYNMQEFQPAKYGEWHSVVNVGRGWKVYAFLNELSRRRFGVARLFWLARVQRQAKHAPLAATQFVVIIYFVFIIWSCTTRVLLVVGELDVTYARDCMCGSNAQTLSQRLYVIES